MLFRLAGVLLVVAASGRIVATYRVLSNTTDEPAHLAAGMEWIENGTYTYEDQHPPLARIAGALGLRLAGARWGHGADMYFEGFRLLGSNHRYEHNLFYSRAAMLPFFWIACGAVFLWGRRCGGDAAGALATLVFTTIPPVLGHAGLATTDMALTAFTGAAGLAGVMWLEKTDVRRSVVFGLLAGLAVASKFSALVYLPAGLLGIWVCGGRGKGSYASLQQLSAQRAAPRGFWGRVVVSMQPRSRGLCALQQLSAQRAAPRGFWGRVVIPVQPRSRGLCALQQLSAQRAAPRGFWGRVVVSMQARSRGLCALQQLSAQRAAPRGFWGRVVISMQPRSRGLCADRRVSIAVSLAVAAGVITVVYRLAPVPVFFHGIRSVWEHNQAGHPAWLMGRRSQHGFWYYYLAAGVFKTPAAMLMLCMWAVAMRKRAVAAPLGFAGAILLAASFGSINIGIRHVLPVYIGLSVACGVAALEAIRGGWMTRAAVASLLAWQVVSGVVNHPDYLAYTNELAGDRPDRILADSDLDWGQDMGRLAARLNQLGVKRVTFKISSPGYLAAGNDFPFIVNMPDGDRPIPGWNAVSVTPWRISGQPTWPDRFAPRERVGRSILLYYFPQ